MGSMTTVEHSINLSILDLSDVWKKLEKLLHHFGFLSKKGSLYSIVVPAGVTAALLFLMSIMITGVEHSSNLDFLI